MTAWKRCAVFAKDIAKKMDVFKFSDAEECKLRRCRKSHKVLCYFSEEYIKGARLLRVS